jgi:hypothetical protein
MQKCSKCDEVKPLKTGFYANKSRPRGYSYECKECSKLARKKYRENNNTYVNQLKKELRRQIKIDAFLKTIDHRQFCDGCREKLHDLADDWIK